MLLASKKDKRENMAVFADTLGKQEDEGYFLWPQEEKKTEVRAQ